MPTVAVYRCPKCGTEYRPLDAGARRFICCGVSLQRVEQKRNNATAPQRSERSASVFASAPVTPSQRPTELIEVIPPRENTVDALAVATMLNTFSTGSLFSLEIAGDEKARRFLVRGTPEGVAHIRRQLQAIYDQVAFRQRAVEEDPGRPSSLSVACAQLKLSRPAYLPVRSYEDGDFEKADPVKGLLGAFDGLQTDERVLTQLILTPAPQQWSRRYEGSARQVEKSFMGESMSLGLVVRQFASVITVMTAVAFGLWAILSFIQKAWLTFFFAGILFSFAAYGVMWLYSLISEQANIDPKLVQAKIATPAYDASLRLFVVGRTQERADQKLRELVAAYCLFNLQSGNSFTAKRVDFDPRVMRLESASWLDELTAHVTRLSTNEIASLWHLPVGEVQGVEHTMAKRILPLPATVEKGILIGHSVHQGKRIPVHLHPETLLHHSFMVAKTQMGKSTLMAHLAAEAMRQDSGLVVIDPHGDLVRTLLGLVPLERTSDVVYIDLSDSQRVVGFNLLDLTQGRPATEIVSNFVHAGELIWKDNWGPRMEDALRMSLRTLLEVNERLIEEGKPQFTVIDIPALLELESFKVRVLDKYIRDDGVLQWWAGYYDQLHKKFNVEIINPVLTKMHRFAEHPTVRNIVGQSRSTVNFQEILAKRQILLINTATGIIGPDAAGLLGAVIVDRINFAVRQQTAIPDPAQRARVVIVVDEFQSIPGVDYPKLLAELQKMGASFILATQALGQLDAIDPELRQSIMSNAATLFVFQTSAEDADRLRHELDNVVDETDITNLAHYACYVKAEFDNVRLPVMHVETLAAPQASLAAAERILYQMARYTSPADHAVAERRQFQQNMYGQEMEDIRSVIHNKSEQARKALERARANDPNRPRDAGVANSVPPDPTIEEITDDQSLPASSGDHDSSKTPQSAKSDVTLKNNSQNAQNSDQIKSDSNKTGGGDAKTDPNPEEKDGKEEEDDPRANP